MSEAPELPAPPAGSKATLVRTPDGVMIHLPPLGRERVGGPWALALSVFVVIVLALGVCPSLVRGEVPPGSCLLCCAAPVAVAWLLALLLGLAQSTRRYECSVSADAVTVRARTLLGEGVVWSWPRRDVKAVGAWNGLWVVAWGRQGMMQERDGEEVAWLALVLRTVLGVPGSEPPGRHDAAVEIDLPKYRARMPGILRVARGRMTLRHGVADRPVLHFVARPRGPLLPVQPVWSGRTLALAPDDLSCRPAEPRGSVLEIEPTGSGFVLRLWSEDPDALPRALARFWGGDLEE